MNFVVVKRNGESNEKLINRAIMEETKEGIKKQYKDRSRYEKPSAKRRRKKLEKARNDRSF
jgi:ribosomal protein S21